MKKLNITIPKTPENSYPIFIGQNILEKINNLIDLKKYSKISIITDKNISKYWLKKLENVIPIPYISIIIKPGEKEKNIETVKYIWEEMIKAKLDRESLIINLGGGVIGDMGGFAASTYMRGIDFINIPTTLLAMVDESVGGKTGIDFANIKNVIGTFNQPREVIIDIETLKTLPKREFLSGFAEIIKHGLISDKTYFHKVTAKIPLQFSQTELVDIIKDSCKIKQDVVEADVKEQNLRKILNFGHTVGHAIEALSLETNQPLLHGEAISIGIVAENEIAVELGILSRKIADLVKEKLSLSGLPVVSNCQFPISEIMERMKSDKKNERGKIKFTLLKNIGEALINQEAQNDIIENKLKNI